MTQQRIINKTVDRLRDLAVDCDAARVPPDMIAAKLRQWATELDDGADGRETQEKRKPRKR